ncbi:MAG: diaminopimelate epimerase [Terrimicrobiaceae bacterium]|nr:diaminopimelate epimerase [Terrimicrobiaceae bacterium]
MLVMELIFTKMNGAGNDFVVVDNRSLAFEPERGVIARLCDRHRGVGSDGLLLAEPAERGADLRMRYFNADGGEAEMCGNGARCFARFARRLLGGQRESVSFETQAGVVAARFEGEEVALAMSDPRGARGPLSLEVRGRTLEAHFLDTGVPHAVVFVSDLEAVDVAGDGAALRWHEAFAPRGTNANFAKVEAPGRLALRTYERGVEAETLACGTGVCAAALIHADLENCPPPVRVRVRGGDVLSVDFRREEGGFRGVVLTGPAEFVFEGRIVL